MNLGLGPDFRAARSSWLYQQEGHQVWWVAILLALAGFAVLSVLQLLAGVVVVIIHMVIDPAMQQQAALINPADKDALTQFAMKDIILGIGPAAIGGAFAAWGLAGIGVGDRSLSLGLRPLRLGLLGWVVVVAGFIIAMMILNVGFVKLFHVDEKQIGVVEKAMADLRNNPTLYLLSMPGIMLLTPVVEEFIFRGAVFHALLSTRLGWIGTVLLTSGVWALIHGATAPWAFVGILFMMGIVLGLLLLRFGSLWVTIACHGAWNLLTALIIYATPSLQ